MDCVMKNKRLFIHFDTVFLMLEWQSFNFKEVGASKDTSCDALPGVSAESKAL